MYSFQAITDKGIIFGNKNGIIKYIWNNNEIIKKVGLGGIINIKVIGGSPIAHTHKAGFIKIVNGNVCQCMKLEYHAQCFVGINAHDCNIYTTGGVFLGKPPSLEVG